MDNDEKLVPFDVRVRELGREDRFFSSTREATNYLTTERRNNHVSICYTNPSTGLLRTLFVSIDQDGQLFETYGKKAPVAL